MTTPTQEEKRILIAEACGWKKNAPCVDENEESQLAWSSPSGRWPLGRSYLPNYFDDLNDCHDMEAYLGAQDVESYIIELERIVGNGAHPCHNPMFANSAQRAEAFGITMGLWK